MEKSRTGNSINNIITGIVLQIVTILLNFISRTFFIKILGDECLGLNGLFSTILSMLSLTELGIGFAISFYLYKPISEHDEERIKTLIGFYKFCYRIIGLVIAVIGILIIPFLPKIVNISLQMEYNPIIVYLLFLFNSVIGYFFFSYPTTVLNANQENHIVNRVSSLFIIISTVGEIITLFIWRNYYAYLIVRLIIVVIKNIFLAIITTQKYPYIKCKAKMSLKKSELKKMFKDVYALLILRLSSQLFNSTDNLFISATLSTILVGYNSNYLMIITAIQNIVNTIIYSCSASIGNLYAIEQKEKSEEVFVILDFINFILSIVCTVSLFQLLNPFITLVWGERYTFSRFAVLLMSMNFYTTSSLYTVFCFRQSMGLFQYCKYTQLFAAIINIILDLLLIKIWKLEGLFLATFISSVFISIYPYIKNIYTVGFEMDYRPYMYKTIYRYLICILSCISTCFLNVWANSSVIGFLFSGLVCVLFPLIVVILTQHKTREFILLMQKSNQCISLLKNKLHLL